MGDVDEGRPEVERLAGHLDEQAVACGRLGSSLSERVLAVCAADLRRGGPARDVLADHLDAPGPAATGLRLLGGLHLLALTGRAPDLARHYPSCGGSPGPDLPHDVLSTVAAHADSLRAAVVSPPQTNEVGRAAALVGGLLHVLRRLDAAGAPVRLHEIGSSAGLNLLADRFRYGTDDGRWWPRGAGRAGAGADQERPGRPDRPAEVELPGAWHGDLPPLEDPLHVVERRGSDVAPVDLGDPAARDRLLAYVWPDQQERTARTRAALALAAAERPVVDRLEAVGAVGRVAPAEGTVTVLWHSVMWQYVPPADQQRALSLLRAAGARAQRGAPLVHLRLEPRRPAPDRPHEFLVSATTWPGGDDVVLGRAAPHGPPVVWTRTAR